MGMAERRIDSKELPLIVKCRSFGLQYSYEMISAARGDVMWLFVT